MKLTFIYANAPDLKDIPKYEQYESSIDLPDEIQHLIGIEERLLGIAEMVAQLTCCSLWVTCSGLKINKHQVTRKERSENLRYDWYSRTIAFYYIGRSKKKFNQQRRILQILGAQTSDLPRNFHMRRGKNRRQRLTLAKNLFQLQRIQSQLDDEFYNSLESLNVQIEFLLNTEPESIWGLKGLNPTWVDYNLFERYRKKQATWQKAQSKKSQQASKKGKGKVGNTRRYGAIPGVFQGVQFRSQLEIRAATELSSRGIDWVYEKERLGEGNYLVDFYLPDHKIWIEVKGKFEARDHYLLKDVAVVLEKERQEQLFVFTSGKCFRVTETEFEPIKRSRLWEVIAESNHSE